MSPPGVRIPHHLPDLKGSKMETLLLLGALAYGTHYYMNKDTDVADAKDEIVVGEVFHTNEGLDKLDWSKAGNFRVTSSTNDITWVMYTGG